MKSLSELKEISDILTSERMREAFAQVNKTLDLYFDVFSERSVNEHIDKLSRFGIDSLESDIETDYDLPMYIDVVISWELNDNFLTMHTRSNSSSYADDMISYDILIPVEYCTPEGNFELQKIVDDRKRIIAEFENSAKQKKKDAALAKKRKQLEQLKRELGE